MRGKALFIRHLSKMSAIKYTGLGYTWAVVPWLWQQKDGKFRRPNREFRDYLHFQALGVPVYLMVYVRPGSWNDAIRDTVLTASELNVKGVILDAEKEWRGKDKLAGTMAAYARRYCQSVGLEVGLTSFGSAHAHRTFPYESFAPYMDFGIPQLYDTSLQLDVGYFDRGLKAWDDAGFTRLIPAYSEFKRVGGKTRYKLPFEMARYLTQAGRTSMHTLPFGFPNARASVLWTRPGVPRRQGVIELH